MKDGVSGRFFPGDFLPAAHWGCLGRCRHLGSTLWAEHRRSPAAGSGAEPRESGAHWHSDDLQPGLCLDWGCHGISFGAAQSEYLRSLNHSEPTKKNWCFDFSDGECAVFRGKCGKCCECAYCKLLYRRDCPRNLGLATTHTHILILYHGFIAVVIG
jgi:hypothetical protein